jgi:hypothetical protein
LLKNPHRIGCAEHGDGAGQPDALGSSGCRRKDYRRGGVQKFRSVVFAHAKNVEADAVSGFNALEKVLNGLYRLFVLARGEAVDSEFHGTKVAGMQLPTPA